LLARLFGAAAAKPADNKNKAPADAVTAAPVVIDGATAIAAAAAAGIATAVARETAAEGDNEPVPLAAPVLEEESPVAEEPPAPAAPAPAPAPAPVVASPAPLKAAPAPAPPVQVPAPPTPTAPAQPAAPPQLCPICGAQRKGVQSYCDDCGWMFPAAGAPVPVEAMAAAADPPPAGRLMDRYELGELQSERGGLARYRGTDHGMAGQPAPVMILRMAVPEPAEILPAEEVSEVADRNKDGLDTDEMEILPGFDQVSPEPLPVATVEGEAIWPSIAWEKALLEKTQSPFLPRILDSFADGGFEYLVEEIPQGRSLWDAWDDPDATSTQRYGFLKEIARGIHEIHQAGAIFEAMRPDHFVITENAQVRLNDLGNLLPLPLPADLLVRVSLYTPPELVLSPDQVTPRADLYGFGAMLYALEYLHHDLAESDFQMQFSPKLITDRCPDVHPAFFRLVSKTFVRDVNTRFPTDEAVKEDATGFAELIRTLDVCGRAFDAVRFDIAAWTTTGMVRTGNEDALALLHAVESRQDELTEYAMLLLADGMGGYEAGEVAAAMAIASLRKYLLKEKMFAALAGESPPSDEQFNVEGCKQIMLAALRQANKEVYTASRTPGAGKRGMGCTAEAIYVDPHNLVVGHVGDSRTYHLSQGRLIQITRDQTFVNRMVELGALTPEEAEDHPRKNELQQAIGGQPDVQPGLYATRIMRGDWIVVCSDGLSNHIPPEDLQRMLLREATSAEEAARRLLNLVNLRGATDNATVIIIRAC
jgi:protein phosphatase